MTRLRPIWRAWTALIAAGTALAALPAGAVAQRDAPKITRAPSLAGLAQVGQRLEAYGAAWNGRPPFTTSYRWCDTGKWLICQLVGPPGEPFYALTDQDLGKKLRVLLTVSNADGQDHEWSAWSAVVVAAPPLPAPTATPTPTPLPTPTPTTTPPPTPTPASLPAPAPLPLPAAVPTPAPEEEAKAPPRMMRPAAVVRIRGWLTDAGATISLLTVTAPRGVTISARCHGRSCPRRALTRTAAVAPAAAAVARRAKVTRLQALEGPLRAGTRLEISVTRPGFIGKHTVFRIRRDKAPARRDRCLYPGSRKPATCPAG
jgi:hypothetical protein